MLLLGFCTAVSLSAQTQKPNLPNPVKFIAKYDVVANVVRDVLEKMDFKIELEDRKGGKIVTKPYEFITGSLTSSELEKVAVARNPVTGSLLKARYSVEGILEIVSPTETMITVHTNIEALSKEVDGTEKWMQFDSLGTYERRILGKITAMLMSNKAVQEEKKGFWGQQPQPVNPSQPRLPTIPAR
jgi:hypothetical protein